MSRPRKPRRGALLLIVLSILVLFLLIALTYVIIATHYKDAAESLGHKERTGDHPQKLLDGALYQIVRDTTNPQSVVLGHGLLRDLYGSDSVLGSLDASANVTALVGTGNQIIKFDVTPGNLSTLSGYYNGCVLTMTEGPAKGLSTRIVGYDANGSTIRVLAFNSDTSTAVRPENGDNFLINGRPFNGTGFGYDPSTGKLDINDPVFGVPMALLPNRVGDNVPASLNQFLAGGADESYDAVDYQNMLLAMVLPGATTSANIIPSMHRPALINYWKNLAGGPWADTEPNYKDFRRRVIFRPMPWDHLNFSGSNPAFAAGRTDAQYQDALINGVWDSDGDSVNDSNAWDVDNDGDGIPDSIWVDLGYTIQTAPDGRRYKPLFAILCQDLDGRLNVNAHGNLQQLLAGYTSPTPPGPYAGGAGTIANPQRGLGVGPADIYLGNLFSSGTEHQNILNGRYGEPSTTPLPGIATTDDWLSIFRNVGLPMDYADVNNPSSYGSPPDTRGLGVVALDYTGHPWTLFMGQAGETMDDPYELNLSGHAAEGTGQFDAASANYVDTPYTLSELERLLRMGDIDASALPDRLRALASTFFGNASKRRIITTRSMHIPVPNVQMPPALRSATTPGSPHIFDIVKAKFKANGVMNDPLIESQLSILLPFEILHGQKMNLNRLWGNGEDDSSNGVVDEPGEGNATSAISSETIWPSGVPGGFDGIVMDYANNDPIATAAINANPTLAGQIVRQTYARHLYCLMMLLVDQGYDHPGTEASGLPQNQQQELTARRIAQWAINVVDFRDPDAIMTPFEYDAKPFNANGWDTAIDGVLSTALPADGRLVWGCEYPDLVLTETIAFHDRRVKDTKNDDGMPPEKRQKPDMSEGDSNLDQYRIPQGSLFVELYCTRGRFTNNPIVPRELYNVDTMNQQIYLDLGRMAPVGGGAQYPVWRMVISEEHHTPPLSGKSALQRSAAKPDSTSFDPGQISSILGNLSILPGVNEPLSIDRIVWFANVSPAAAGVVDQDKIYYGRGPALLPAGGYAVVGPRPETYIGSRKLDPPDDLSLQKIILNAGGVTYYRDVAGVSTIEYPTVGTDIQQPLAIIAAADPPTNLPADPSKEWTDTANTAPNGIGINVSEPLPGVNYYKEPTHKLDPARAIKDTYDDPLAPTGTYPDDPFDSDANAPLQNGLEDRGTTEDYKTVYLQRLANPLQPWHPVANPYITIDWMPIDLTVFNGEDEKPAGFVLPEFDPVDPNPGGDPDELFQTRRRNGEFQNLWSTSTAGPDNPAPPVATGANNYFPYDLRHFVAASPPAPDNANTLGYLNRTFGNLISSPPAPGAYIGAPASPFPWLTWNNRPYVSHLELMQVPACSSARLLHKYKFPPVANPVDPYDTTDGTPPEQFRAPYGHLLNFFQTDSTPNMAAHFYRLLDYVEVPSRFVGSDIWFNPGEFDDNAVAAADTFRPPYNRLSRFRNPGPVNINTVFDPVAVNTVSPVWQGIAHAFPSMTTNTFWDKLVESRQGYNGTMLDPAYPSQFANPFRSAASSDLMPLPLMEKNGVQATLLRSDPNISKQPLFDFSSTQVYDNTQRNPYFRYQGMQRLGNLITTHSNVYAIWITVGFFEVDPLGQELGSETGEVKRHRAFYIIDRSIPVAFEPGKNHNVERAIGVRRFIE